MKFYIKKGCDLKELSDWIAGSKGDEFEIEIKEVKDIRSVQQNSFFHSVLIDAFVRLGDTNRQRIKRILKEHFLRTYDENGQYIDAKRTRDLSVDEMRIFIDNCVNLLADYGGYLETNEYNEYLEIKK